MSGLGLTFLRRGGQAHPTSGFPYIKFKDEEVFNILMAKGVSSDGVGITKKDALKVTSIGDWFRGSNIVEFNELVYFKNVTTIPESGFRDCKSLKTIDLTNIKVISLCCFTGSDLSEYDLYMPNCESFTGSADWSQWFSGSNLRSIRDTGMLSSYPGIVSGGKPYGCFTATKIKSAHINSYVRVIGKACFAGCQSLENVTIDEGLETIETDAFTNCTSVKKMILPASLKFVNNKAMGGMTSLESVVFSGAVPPTFGSALIFPDSGTSAFTIYVPDASVDAYKTATYFGNYAGKVKPLSQYNG